MTNKLPLGNMRAQKGALLYKLAKLFRDHPFWGRLFIVLSVLYIISPLDFIPDFILGFGFIDDFFVLLSLIVAVYVEYQNYKASKNPQ